MQLVRILYTYRYCILQLSVRPSRRRANGRNPDARHPLGEVRATIDIAFAPVMYELQRDAKNATTEPISCGGPALGR